MKLAFAAIALLGLMIPQAKASCPFTMHCELDGTMMMEEDTYYNGIHKSIKYGHTNYKGEHHYVVVQCN